MDTFSFKQFMSIAGAITVILLVWRAGRTHSKKLISFSLAISVFIASIICLVDVSFEFLPFASFLIIMSALIAVSADVLKAVMASAGVHMKGIGSGEDHVSEICRAAFFLAERKVGGLIVIERRDDLDKHIGGGLKFDADVRAEVLAAIFAKESPVHDGAVVVSRGRIKRLKGILPIRTNVSIPLGIGTRHRAAIGITERADAVSVVISEERGEVSVVFNGILVKCASEREIAGAIREAVKDRYRRSGENAADPKK
jgi:DNA integrity scanning protein DisA with diadenylate cyclase activity